MLGFPKPVKQIDFALFTIYDSKTQFYDRPLFAANKQTMIRDMLNFLRDPENRNNKLNVNAEDYSIFEIGTYDKSTGMLTPQNLEHVANLHDLRAMAQPSVQNTDKTWPHGAGPSA